MRPLEICSFVAAGETRRGPILSEHCSGAGPIRKMTARSPATVRSAEGHYGENAFSQSRRNLVNPNEGARLPADLFHVPPWDRLPGYVPGLRTTGLTKGARIRTGNVIRIAEKNR